MWRSFFFGAAAYPLLEVATRGRTHYSMAIAGGASMMLIRTMSRVRGSRISRSVLCGTGITLIEYACGRIWNRDYRVWDYRRQPFNLHGQVCLPYTALWCGLSGIVLTCLGILHPLHRG